MKRIVSPAKIMVAVGVGILATLLPRPAVAVSEIVPDGNTVLIDHFNGSMAGTPHGSLAYEPSLSGLNQAVRFGPGVWVQYAFPAWYSYCCGADPGTQGTIEMWVKPDTWGDLLNFNWYNTSSLPSAGHVLYQVGLPGIYGYSTWNWERGSLPSGLYRAPQPPTGQWTHLALSWGPTVSKLYVNGAVYESVNANVYPAIGSTVYAYLNVWGGGTFAGLIDEFHISKVQRTDAEILAHATRVIGVSIDIKPGSDPNCFNVNGHGVIPVAIFGAPGFDVADIDTSSLLLGGLAVRVRGNKGPQCGREDSSGDGIDDLVCQFEDDPTSWVAGGAMATLTGLLTDGTLFEGTDSICVVP